MVENIFPIEDLEKRKKELIEFRKYGVCKESVEKWAQDIVESYMLTDEYKAEKAEMDRELKDFILYGRNTTWFNNELLKEASEQDYLIKTEELSIEQIIERFGDSLTEKDIENINNLRNG